MSGELNRKASGKGLWSSTDPLLLSQKMMIGGVLLVLLTVCLTIGTVLRLNLKIQQRRVESLLKNVSQIVAYSPVSINTLRSGLASDDLTRFLDGVVKSVQDLDVIKLYDVGGKCLYLSDRREGSRLPVDPDERALSGESYFSRTSDENGEQLRCYVPVFDPIGGTQLGYVITSALVYTLKSQTRDIYVDHFVVACVMCGIAVLFTWVAGKRIKSSLLGYEPGQMSKIFLERGEVINSLEEGLIAVDARGRVYLSNRAARKMLSITKDELHGSVLDHLYPQIRIQETLDSDKPLYNRAMEFGPIHILCNRIPIREDDMLLGAVAILRNRTELTRMAEELTGVNHMVDALRSNTHEFKNKLHVILGLLRIGAPEEAEKYICDISSEQTEVIGPVLRKIQNKNLGALILGKLSHCREFDINFKLANASSVPVISAFLSGNSFVTLVGNLLENAIEAVNAKEKDDGEREVTLLIREDDRSLMITVDDTGVGMTPDELERLKKGGYSSKGRNRGTGMRLIKSVLASNNGEIQVDSERGVGTSITVCFTRREKRDQDNNS